MKKFNELCIKAYLKLKENDGMGTIEVVLIAVALIALVIIFRQEGEKVVKNLVGKIESRSESLFH